MRVGTPNLISGIGIGAGTGPLSMRDSSWINRITMARGADKRRNLVSQRAHTAPVHGKRTTKRRRRAAVNVRDAIGLRTEAAYCAEQETATANDDVNPMHRVQ